MRLVIAAPAAAIASVIGRWLNSHRTVGGPLGWGRRRPTMSKYDHQKPNPMNRPSRPVAIVSASCSAFDRPSTTPMITSPSTMIVNRPNRSTSEWRRGEGHAELGDPAEADEGDEPRHDERGPDEQAQVRRQDGAHERHDDGDHHAQDVDAGQRPVLRLVLAPDREPEPAHDREQGRVHDRERAAALARCPGRERGEEDEDPHLQEHECPGAAVLAAVDLDVQRPVDPGEPDQAEDHREFRGGPSGDILREVVGRLSDDGDVHEVVEQLEVGDDAIADRWRRGAAAAARTSP